MDFKRKFNKKSVGSPHYGYMFIYFLIVIVSYYGCGIVHKSICTQYVGVHLTKYRHFEINILWWYMLITMCESR